MDGARVSALVVSNRAQTGGDDAFALAISKRKDCPASCCTVNISCTSRTSPQRRNPPLPQGAAKEQRAGRRPCVEAPVLRGGARPAAPALSPPSPDG